VELKYLNSVHCETISVCGFMTLIVMTWNYSEYIMLFSAFSSNA